MQGFLNFIKTFQITQKIVSKIKWHRYVCNICHISVILSFPLMTLQCFADSLHHSNTKQRSCPLHRCEICQFYVRQLHYGHYSESTGKLINPTSLHLTEQQNNREIAYESDIIKPSKPGKYHNS